MFRMWGVWNVGCWVCEMLGCGMLEMLDVLDVGSLVCGMFRMWDVWDVACLGCEMFGM